MSEQVSSTTSLSPEELLKLPDFSLKEKEFFAKFAVPGIAGSATREQVVAYLATLDFDTQVKPLLRKISGVTNMIAVEITKARKSSANSEVAPGLGLASGVAAGMAATEFARRAELLTKGTEQEFFGTIPHKEILAALQTKLDKVLKNNALRLLDDLSGKDFSLRFANQEDETLFTVTLTTKTRVSQLTQKDDLSVVVVRVSEMNQEVLARYGLSKVSDIIDDLKDAAKGDGAISTAEGLAISIKTILDGVDLVQKSSLNALVFDTMSRVLVENEREYQEKRRAAHGALYEKAKAEKDTRICAACGSEKASDRTSCAACGAPYSMQS